MNNFRFYLVILLWCGGPCLQGNAQDTAFYREVSHIMEVMKMEAHPISTGSKIPDGKIQTIWNFNSPSAWIHDFKGKLLILDFWHQYCGACLEQFPKFEALQKKFGDKVLILPVTFQRGKSVQSFFERRRKLGFDMRLPSVVDDTMLHAWFPHEGNPYEVWISPEGKVIAMTDADEVTEENIRDVLTGKANILNNKIAFHKVVNGDTDIGDDFNPNSPTGQNILYRSVLSKYNDSLVSSRNEFTAINSRTKILLTNQTVIDFYKFAYVQLDPKKNFWLYEDNWDKRIDIAIQDSIKFLDRHNVKPGDNYRAFNQGHLYCYEAVLPPFIGKLDAIWYMIGELDNLFGVRSSIKTEWKPCLHLVCFSIEKFHLATKSLNTEYIKSRLEMNAGHSESADHLHITFFNTNAHELAGSLNFLYNIPFVINKTGIAKKFNLSLDFHSVSITDIREGLRKYGLDLIPVTCNIPVLKLQKQFH